MTTVAVIVFPGSNCDEDTVYAFERLGATVKKVWHAESTLGKVDAVVLPGGFSYGDYLRCGAIAKFSPIMGAVTAFADKGGKVLGICNGFQILVESGLLPGALLRNRDLKFICKTVSLRLETTETPFTQLGEKSAIYQMPIAHMEGNYFIDAPGLHELEAHDQIVLRYVDNPNGAVADIAGICNRSRTVFGLMPHPERATEGLLGGEDGIFVLKSLLNT